MPRAAQRTDVAPNTIVLTVSLAVFLGCHACVGFIVLPAAHPDRQQSHLTQLGDQD
jgi:hypothetical protein